MLLKVVADDGVNPEAARTTVQETKACTNFVIYFTGVNHKGEIKIQPNIARDDVVQINFRLTVRADQAAASRVSIAGSLLSL